MKNTKEKILETALELFAAKGYEAVSVSDIAGKLGMTKGALYKHYTNKQDILDSIILRMEEMDYERAEAFYMPQDMVTTLPLTAEQKEKSLKRLIEYSKAQLSYWTEDPFASAFRRMLTIEQYRIPEMRELYQQYLAGGPLEYVAYIFTECGSTDSELAALRFYAPMFTLYSVLTRRKMRRPARQQKSLPKGFLRRRENGISSNITRKGRI